MPKVYIAFDNCAQTPLVVDNVLGLTAARAHLKSPQISVLRLDIDNDGVIRRSFGSLQNYEAEQRRAINDKLQALREEKQKLKSLFVNLNPPPQ